LPSKLCLLLRIAIDIVEYNISDLVLCPYGCLVDEIVESGYFLLYFGESAVEFVLFAQREPAYVVHISGVTDFTGGEHHQAE
jgi:hypothetical protein